MKRLFPILLMMMAPLLTMGQSYDTALGMRLGTDWGITAKQRVAKLTTIEGIFQSSLQREEVVITLLAEQHFPMLTRRLNIYFGGGLHKGWINEPRDDEPDAPEYEDPFGISMIGGIELSLGRLNLSYDFKPAINISGGENTVYTQTGVSLRYVIIKRDWLNKRKKKKRKRQRRKNKKDGFDWKFWKKWGDNN